MPECKRTDFFLNKRLKSKRTFVTICSNFAPRVNPWNKPFPQLIFDQPVVSVDSAVIQMDEKKDCLGSFLMSTPVPLEELRRRSLIKDGLNQIGLYKYSEFQNIEPRLVAVSKTKPKELIIEAYALGQRHFGENYVQEIIEKATSNDIIRGCPDIKWHFIGHLQRNKVSKLLKIPNLFAVESVDSEKLAVALNAAVEQFYEGDKLNVFVQVNTSGEETKSGCRPDEATNLVKYIFENCKQLNVMGLMTIGQNNNYNTEKKINPDFQCLMQCKAIVCQNLNLDYNKFEVSMGMSGDFEDAIQVGSTNVRVGSLIFGERIAKKPYQVLLDGTTCVAALKNRINIKEQYKKYLDSDVKVLTTQCIIKEVESLGRSASSALFILKNFGQHHCGHDDTPVPAADCILHMVAEKNASRYLVATQDRELQDKCRQMVGVPLLYFHSRMPTLEPPSKVTQNEISAKSLEDLHVKNFARSQLEMLNTKLEAEEPIRKKRKAKGGPNPLSCKKKKIKMHENMKPEKLNFNSGSKKRKKKQSRLVKKIKNDLRKAECLDGS